MDIWIILAMGWAISGWAGGIFGAYVDVTRKGLDFTIIDLLKTLFIAPLCGFVLFLILLFAEEYGAVGKIVLVKGKKQEAEESKKETIVMA